MRSVIIGLLMGLSMSAFGSEYVKKDGKFHLETTPEKWAEGDKICFSPKSKMIECSLVTDMGEIKLRTNNGTETDVMQTYNSNLSDGDQLFLSRFDKFVVRYLALDGDTQDRYIIQVFYSFATSSEAIYVYGKYQNTEDGLKLTPEAFGESSAINFSAFRSSQFVNQTVSIANKVAVLWAKDHLEGTTVDNQN